MKKIIVKLGALAILSAIIGLLTACAATTDPSEAYQGESAHEIYVKGKSALEDKGYTEAIKRFEALDVQYPLGAETASAQFYLIYAYYMKEEYALASAAADRFIRQHPDYPHVDYVYYLRGLSDYYQNMSFFERMFTIDIATRDLAQIRKAYYDFRDLVQHFPGSQYAPAAHQYMLHIRNILADHEWHVAEYYYERRAYLAAANRASNLVAHYQGAPAVVDGLVLMVKAYHQLGMTRNEQEALRVLKYNYPKATVER